MEGVEEIRKYYQITDKSNVAKILQIKRGVHQQNNKTERQNRSSWGKVNLREAKVCFFFKCLWKRVV